MLDSSSINETEIFFLEEKKKKEEAWRIEGATTLTAQGSTTYHIQNGNSTKNLTKTHN